FLGKAIATTQGFDSRAFIAQRAVNWEVPIHVHSNRNRDEALTELAQRGTLAVIPSLTENSPYTVLECLTRGIVLLASRVGGIPEMLAQSDHATHLFDPNPRALAQALHLALEEGMHSASLAWNPAEVERRWQDFLQDKARVVKQNRIKLHSKAGSPLVSICLVHYNRPHLLAQVLDSLRAQTYRNFEVVLVDDGSPGEAAQRYLDAIQSEFHGHGWQIIRQPNSYLGTARNHAAQAARGDYLLFMDDDNVALPYMLEHFVQAAESSGADILTCVNMPFTGDRVPPLPERIWVPLGGAAGAGLYRNAFGDANALWKRSAFEHIGGYTTDYGVGHEDWELFSDAVLAGLRLEVVPEPLYWYRVNPQGMLRAGDHWADHARSVRPYLRHDPNGLGMALAYGLYLQRLREVGANGPQVHAVRWSAVVRLIRLAADPSLRAQFLGALRAQGVRAALRRALAKAGR
ncbi:MAG: glycosyltransferase, partial [Candidatus Igneacidithiobacillus chanchocoensis]